MLSKGRIIFPSITAFAASFCIMVMEIAAGRILARYLGTSLYTWTSVIGVVLAGIALGSYAGGRLADIIAPRKLLSGLFIFASIGCLTVPVLNSLAGEMYPLMLLPWTLRIAAHVTLVFSIPSILLGMAGPVVAKFALDQGLPPGKTVGEVYAWSAAGSIAGTFVTGFFLTAVMGTAGIMFSVSFVLAAMGILYGYSYKRVYLWPVVLATLGVLAANPNSMANGIPRVLGFFEKNDHSVVWEGYTRYAHITITESESFPETRELILDGILHSVVDMKDPSNIFGQYQYPYLWIYGALAEHKASEKQDISVMVMGGGGYVLPQYIMKNWPESSIEVVEIDPGVTEAAEINLNFNKVPGIDIYHMDARNRIDDILRKNITGNETRTFDIIYGDAISGLSVPFQLTTSEFSAKIKQLLAPHGVYAVNVVDNYASGRFLGAIINTIKSVFPHVVVYSTGKNIEVPSSKKTFVILCSNQPFDISGFMFREFEGYILSDEELRSLNDKAEGLSLTDDHAPVDSLLIPVLEERGAGVVSMKMKESGDNMAKRENMDEALRYYRKAIEINPNNSAAYNNLGNILVREGRFEEASDNFRKAAELSPKFDLVFHNLGMTMMQEGKLIEAERFFREAIRIRPDLAESYYGLGVLYSLMGYGVIAEGFYTEALLRDPSMAEAYYALGNLMFESGKPNKALENYEFAIKADPEYFQAYNNAGTTLEKLGNIEKAEEYFKKAIEIKPDYVQARDNLKAAAARKRSYMDGDATLAR